MLLIFLITQLNQIHEICLRYRLPHPLHILQNPPNKQKFKQLVKSRVLDYWETVLREECAQLSSLKYFHPQFMSLARPHPLWTSAGSSPAKVAMATVQSRMLSGRYRSQHLCSKWSPDKNGNCLLSTKCANEIEDIDHILTKCEALEDIRHKLRDYTTEYAKHHPLIAPLLSEFCNTTSHLFCQFLLDCSVIPAVITAVQKDGPIIHQHLFEITRTWIYTLHKERMKRLGRWNFI